MLGVNGDNYLQQLNIEQKQGIWNEDKRYCRANR